jgi:hypothetical protein
MHGDGLFELKRNQRVGTVPHTAWDLAKICYDPLFANRGHNEHLTSRLARVFCR